MYTNQNGNEAEPEQSLTVIKSDADSNVVQDCCNPLCEAIGLGQQEMVNILLNQGVDPNTSCPVHDTPINYSVYKRQVQILRLLIASGANIRDKLELPQAPIDGFTYIGIDEDIEEYKWDRYLGISNTYSRKFDIYGSLKFVAKIDAKIKGGFTPLHIAAKNGFEELVLVLLQHGHAIDAVTYGDFTPLHYAVTNRHEKIVDILLNNGANVNALGRCGLTPLHVAIVDGYLELVKTLIDNGADVRLNLAGNITPLHIAANNRRRCNVTRLILQHSPDVDLKCDLGYTALHIAVQMGNPKIVSLLMNKGFDINIDVDYFDSTPLGMAYEDLGDFIDEDDEKYNEYINLYDGRDEDSDEDNDGYDNEDKDDNFFLRIDLSNIHNIKLHILKLIVAGLHVSESNFVSVKDLVDLSKTEGEIDVQSLPYRTREQLKFYQRCIEEIEKIKVTMLNDEVSLYYILTTDNPGYILNSNVLGALKTLDFKQLPIYGSLIESKFEKHLRRVTLIEQGKKSFRKMLGNFVLPEEIVGMIIRKLENRDLEYFIAII